MMIHHCIGPNPDHGIYRGISEAVRVASTFLSDPSVAPEEIDVYLIYVSLLITEGYCSVCGKIETSLYFPTFRFG